MSTANSSSSASQTCRVREYEAKGDKYVLRGLQEAEIDAWASFCASVFAYKAHPPPPSYFSRHYYNDPDRGQASFIRVAVCSTRGDIVASCRIFCRQIHNADGPLKVGGIGEVCTKMEHRKRGLSKQLLHDAFDIMRTENMQFSLLHAAPTFFPFYQSVGYVNTESQFQLVTVRLNALRESSAREGAWIIRQAQFPEDTDSLMKSHQEYSEKRFSGCVIRSQAYWNEYVSQELKDSLWVCHNANKSRLLGWLSVRPRGVDPNGKPRYQLREFGCSSLRQSYPVIIQLLADAVEAKTIDFSLHLPARVLQDIQESCPATDQSSCCFDFASSIEENDQGWMYKALQGDDAARVVSVDIPHLVWPTDSF